MIIDSRDLQWTLRPTLRRTHLDNQFKGPLMGILRPNLWRLHRENRLKGPRWAFRDRVSGGHIVIADSKDLPWTF